MKGSVSLLFSVSPEAYQVIHQVSRYLYAFFGVLVLISAAGWLMGDHRERKEARRAIPAAGTVGELVVITGNEELPAQTWFPVTREGVLGSVRSCDLVIPADGVRSRHLDFSWQDGIGLLIRPRSGCEVRVNNVLLDCKSDPESVPLTHGSSLQVGSAVLRLHVFAALDHVSASRNIPETDIPYPDASRIVPEPGMAAPAGSPIMPEPGMAAPAGSPMMPEPGMAAPAGSPMMPEPGMAAPAGSPMIPEPGMAAPAGSPMMPEPGIPVPDIRSAPGGPVLPPAWMQSPAYLPPVSGSVPAPVPYGSAPVPGPGYAPNNHRDIPVPGSVPGSVLYRSIPAAHPGPVTAEPYAGSSVPNHSTASPGSSGQPLRPRRSDRWKEDWSE